MTDTCQQNDLNEKSVILCVPTIIIAEKIIMMMKKLSAVDLKLDKVENLLLLAKESEVRSGIRQFTLEKILDQYCNALLFLKGFVIQTMNALRKYNQQYEYHVEVNPKLQFLDCFKRKFSAAFEDVRECLQFILRLPQESFESVNFEAISALIIQLEDFHASLMNQKIDEGVLKYVLNVGGGTERPILHDQRFQVAQELNKKRVECIVALEVLKSSLKLNPFVTRADVADYLMRKSKLILHIPSSSYFEDFLSASEKIFDLFTVSDASCNQGDDWQLQKHEIDMKKHRHVLSKALFSMGLKTHQASESEMSWIGIPKELLAAVRNQGKKETCAFHSSLATTTTHYKLEAYSDNPSRTFSIILCEEDMDHQYEKLTGTRLGQEKKTAEGENKRTRLENSFIVLEKVGVQGYILRKNSKDDKVGVQEYNSRKKSEDEKVGVQVNSSRKKSEDEKVGVQEKVPISFRISSYKKYSTSDLACVCRLLENKKVMAGYFRLSRNYFSLSSGQTYKYDPLQPILSNNAKLVCSHAVMIVGVLPIELRNMRSSEYKGGNKKKIIHLAYQNSYGKLFGENNGFSRVDASSVRRFFLPIL